MPAGSIQKPVPQCVEFFHVGDLGLKADRKVELGKSEVYPETDQNNNFYIFFCSLV